MSVCHQSASPSVIPSVHVATSPSVNPSVCHMTSPSVILSILHSTHLSVTPPIHPPISPSDHLSNSDHLYTLLPCLSDCPPSSAHSSAIVTSLLDHPSPPDHLYNNSQSPSACLSPVGSLTETMTHMTAYPSSNMIQCMQDSSQSLAVMNGKQSRKAKQFCRAFTNYDLFLHVLDVSHIYPSVSRCVAPPKSGEDAHITHGMCDLSGPTLN